jgi:prepilin-type N-terminal cleavage/methylation domain-containing protein
MGIRRVLRRLDGEGGMTLVELMVTLVILAFSLSITMSILFSVQKTFGKQSDRSLSNDQARLAVEELDKEIRSGNLLYAPTSSGMNLIVYTQTNATTRDPSNQCVQWQITSQQLQRRAWSVDWRNDGDVTGWRVVADHIVNAAPPENPGTPVPAFVLDTSQTSFGSRIMKIQILANQNSSSGRSVEIDDSVTARNTEYGYPQTICSDVPPT